jgi:hypothetical protein
MILHQTADEFRSRFLESKFMVEIIEQANRDVHMDWPGVNLGSSLHSFTSSFFFVELRGVSMKQLE